MRMSAGREVDGDAMRRELEARSCGSRCERGRGSRARSRPAGRPCESPEGRTRRRPRPARRRRRCRRPRRCERRRARGERVQAAVPSRSSVAETRGQSPDACRIARSARRASDRRICAGRRARRLSRAIFSRVPGVMRFDCSRFRRLDLVDGRVEQLRDAEERVAALDSIRDRLRRCGLRQPRPCASMPRLRRLAPSSAVAAIGGAARDRARRDLARRRRAAVGRQQRRRRARDDERLADR